MYQQKEERLVLLYNIITINMKRTFNIIETETQVTITHTWIEEDGSLESNINTFNKVTESHLIKLTLERIMNVTTNF